MTKSLLSERKENMQVLSKLREKLYWLKVNGYFLGIKTPEWWRLNCILLMVRYVEYRTETHWHSLMPNAYMVTSCFVTWEVVLETENFASGFRFETYLPFIPNKGQFRNDHLFNAYYDSTWGHPAKKYWVDLESEPRFRKTLWQILRS